MRMHVLVIGAVVVLLGGGLAWGDLVDQEQTSTVRGLTGLTQVFGQSVVSTRGNISKVEFYLGGFGTNHGSFNFSVTAAIREYTFFPGTGEHRIDDVLAQKEEVFDLMDYPTGEGAFSFLFDTPLATALDEDYFLEFTFEDDSIGVSQGVQVLASYHDNYSYFMGSSMLGAGFANGSELIFDHTLKPDLAFRTYAVPVPSAALLGILGLGSARAFMRRRRKPGIRID